MPPRALTPSGIILVDKPAGPTSFDIVAAVRRRTGARTGHAGTLDPFATGLLLLLSGASTRLQGEFMGLSKRYVTEIDLTARTTTGDVEGDSLGDREPLGGTALDAALDGLRGPVDLPVPAVSAVKIDGERAYSLYRRGVAVEMPVRTMTIDELSVVDRSPEAITLELHVSSGTYVRSIADALGGHCVRLRRTKIGPFHVDEADERSIVPPEDALARL